MADSHHVAHLLLERSRVIVTTETRKFEGKLYGIFLSPFSGETRAQVVDDEGRVHYFFIERAEVEPCT